MLDSIFALGYQPSFWLTPPCHHTSKPNLLQAVGKSARHQYQLDLAKVEC